jgi:hypothetical protein
MKTSGDWTIEGLFEGRPVALGLFAVVRRYVESFGPVTIEVAKTQVSFGSKRKFAWVWLPQMWIKKQPENSIVLAISLRRKVVHHRIKEATEPYPGRWTHHIVIEKESGFDEEVKRWLREAYELAQ